MIGSKLYRKQFLIAAISVFACLFLGSSLLGVIVRLTAPKVTERRPQTPSLFPNFVEKEFNGDLVRGIRKLESLLDADDDIRLSLLDEAGKQIYPESERPFRAERLPLAVHESVPATHGPSFDIVIRLAHEPARYLLVTRRGPMGGPPVMPPPPGMRGPHGPPPPPGFGPGPLFFPASFVMLGLMVLIGIGLALALIFRSLRSAAQQVDDVISELKRGNLKARFPIEREDEIGQAMQRFNSMADEIESLVERLRLAENSRNHLLQELAHDLRTPVSSLRTIQEGIFRSVEMSPEVTELAELAGKEVEYMGRLVEDLLLLAQLTEPRFKASRGRVDLLSLLEEECEALAPKHDANLAVVTKFDVDQALVLGDEHLFQRLIRNALENAFSFSRRKIEVEVTSAGNDGVRVRITDDGDGFSAEALAKFGERREQRVFHKSRGGKLSLGLGSVIMKSVVTLHGGQIRASNAPAGGAVVEFTLPKG